MDVRNRRAPRRDNRVNRCYGFARPYCGAKDGEPLCRAKLAAGTVRDRKRHEPSIFVFVVATLGTQEPDIVTATSQLAYQFQAVNVCAARYASVTVDNQNPQAVPPGM
jgi:hypothetical protein